MTKSANMRASLIPYPVIAAAVGGNPEAVNRVIQHYSGYIAALSMRTSYDKNGFPHSLVDEDMRRRLETKLIISILNFDLTLYRSLTKKAFGQHKADGYDLSVWSRSAGAPRPCCKSAGRDPYQTGERQNQAAKQVRRPVGEDTQTG